VKPVDFRSLRFPTCATAPERPPVSRPGGQNARNEFRAQLHQHDHISSPQRIEFSGGSLAAKSVVNQRPSFLASTDVWVRP
jgi:hypothetical protein